jgi:tetratricopeptide (TPR) repeat protein
LFEYCSDFAVVYAAGDLSTAALNIETLLRRIQRKFPESEIYYPKIVKAVVETHLAGADSGLLYDVQSELVDLANSGNRWIDANLFVMLGNLDLMLGKPASAIKRFEEAIPYISRVDPAIVHNRVLAAVLAEDLTKLDEISAELDRIVFGTVVVRPRDLYRLRLVQALILCIKGQSGLALDNLRELGRIDEDDFDLVRQMLDLTTDQARRFKDVRLIRRILQLLSALEDIARNYSPTTWISIAQRRAYVALEMGSFDEAVTAVRCILERVEFGKSLQPLIDATLVYHAADMQKEARDCLIRARVIREMDVQWPPLPKSDFAYARGLASWLAGFDEVAFEYYEDAGGALFAPWYGDVYGWVNRDVLRITSQ